MSRCKDNKVVVVGLLPHQESSVQEPSEPENCNIGNGKKFIKKNRNVKNKEREEIFKPPKSLKSTPRSKNSKLLKKSSSRPENVGGIYGVRRGYESWMARR